MPNFLIIGAAKSGTSSLHRYLDLHPEISMSSLKEPKYFVREISPEFLREFPEFAGFHVVERDDYLGLFEPGTKLRGESSTAYSNFPQYPGIPAAIHAEIPATKLIYLVRDPVERVVSQYVQWRSARSSYRRDLARLHGIRGLLRDPHDPSANLVSNSFYMRQIKEYMRFFPREALLVIDSAELEADPPRTLSRIFAFLGADPDFRDERIFERWNEGKGKREARSLYLRLRNSVPVRRTVDLLPDDARSRAVEAAYRRLSRPIERPTLDQETRELIERVLLADVAELREFTGLDFPTWSI